MTSCQSVSIGRIGLSPSSPTCARIAATRSSAELCGVAEQLGTVEAGKLADLIVLSQDPLVNISNIRSLKLVLKGGHLADTEDKEGLTDLWQLLFF